MSDPKPKRSFFKRPAWAASATPATEAESTSPDPTSTTKSDAPTDMFSHSHNYTDFVEDRERQRRKKKEKDTLRRSHSNNLDVNPDQPARAGKRRRISEDEDGIKTDVKEPEREKPTHSATEPDSYAMAPTPQKPRVRPETVIELLDDSDDPDANDTNNAQPSSPPSLEPIPAADPDPDADLDEMYDSDPEMRELVRAARKKRRQQERDQSESGSDPVVKLLITSPIPGTTPLIVSRKLSQNLQQVREAWVSKQLLDPNLAAQVFFTFKLRRVYDVTTCRSLGVKVDSWGRVMVNGPFAHGDDEHAEKIHIEAMTADWLQKLKEEKAAPKPNKYLSNAAAAEGKGRGSADGTPAVDGETAAEEPLIKVTLKAKGHADVKIKVRPVSVASFMFIVYSLVHFANVCQIRAPPLPK